MKASLYFHKTQKEKPKEAVSVSHQLLLKGGFVEQVSSGIFSYLPLGLLVLKKIENVDQQKTTNLNLKKHMGNNGGVFVSDHELGKLFTELEKTAEQSGIKLKGTSQNTNTKAKPFPSVDLRLNMECQYPQLIQFLTNLKTAGIMLQPSSMKIQLKDPNQPNLDVQMTVTTYLLKQPPLIGAKS